LGAEKRPRSVSSARPRIPLAALREAVSKLFAPSVMSESAVTLPPLRVGYVHQSPAELMAEPDVLAVIGFGAACQAIDDPRFVRVGLEVVGEPIVEVWRGVAGVRYGRDGAVRWSSDGNYSCFSIEVEEPGGDDIAAAAERAYRELTGCIRASSTPHVLRLWNYFDAINLGAGDDERYRRFCVGRVRGLDGASHVTYPAATAIGRRDGVRVLEVYALAARAAGVPVENPRQVNAWRYPRAYGPTAPTFARGMATPAGQLLISGTAAVVGCVSRHEDDVEAQLDETLANIASLIETAKAKNAMAYDAGGLLKVYVRERAHAKIAAAKLRAAFGELESLIILDGDICRRELLVEIDGMRV
jgi:chorismate lyase/3-hydroxybenzoate synthase